MSPTSAPLPPSTSLRNPPPKTLILTSDKGHGLLCITQKIFYKKNFEIFVFGLWCICKAEKKFFLKNENFVHKNVGLKNFYKKILKKKREASKCLPFIIF